MEPAFQRGDILFLNNRGGSEAIAVGDIVVFKIAGRDVPIVHRVHRRHDAASRGNASLLGGPPAGSAAAAAPVAFLTKGDANAMDDRDLYAPGQLWLARHEIVGRAVAYVPYLGMFTILLNDYPVRRAVAAAWRTAGDAIVDGPRGGLVPPSRVRPRKYRHCR